MKIKINKISLPHILRFRKYYVKGKDDEWWNWTGGIYGKGYGQFRYCGDSYLSHIISWIIKNGHIPDDLLVLHKCDNRVCVNPNHLFLGSQHDNLIDMRDKNRGVQPLGERHHNAKLSDSDILLIRQSNDSSYKLSRKLGVSQSHINAIKSGIRRKIY